MDDSTRGPSNGFVYGKKNRHVVSFDPLTFAEIRDGSIKNNVTFSQRVRELVELGLEQETEGGNSQRDRQAHMNIQAENAGLKRQLREINAVVQEFDSTT